MSSARRHECTPWRTALRWEIGQGVCIGVWLPEPQHYVEPSAESLTLEDRSHASRLSPLRRVGWVGGRVAANRALGLLGVEVPQSIASDRRGAPIFPKGFTGTISHKDSVAVVWVAPDEGAWLGVDVEMWSPPRPRIARHVLTEFEKQRTKGLSDPEVWRRTIATFSIKECVFKALDRDLQRYIAFREAEVEWEKGCHLPRVRLRLEPPASREYELKAMLRDWGEFFITAVEVRPLDDRVQNVAAG